MFRLKNTHTTCFLFLFGLALLSACSSGGSSDSTPIVAGGALESCMACHNGSTHNDYAGPGMENPHPFGGAATLLCTQCHGGDPVAQSAEAAHVPPPPELNT